MGTDSHLWASKVIDAARAIPARSGRSSGTSAAAPPQAASTCSQSRSSSAIWAISASGSTAPALVVPAVAATKKGEQPASRSARMRSARSSGSMRSRASTRTSRTASVPRPHRRAALRNEWCPSAET